MDSNGGETQQDSQSSQTEANQTDSNQTEANQTEANETEPSETELQAQLDIARAALLDGVRRVRARGGPNAEDLIPTARQIQRLTESLITELVRCASSDPGSAPVEAVLGGDGTVPRHQVRTEIERARIADEFPAMATGLGSGATPTANVAVDRNSVPRANVRVDVLCDRDTLATGPHDNTIAEADEGLSVGAGAQDHTLHLSQPNGTPFKTIAPPVPLNRQRTLAA